VIAPEVDEHSGATAGRQLAADVDRVELEPTGRLGETEPSVIERGLREAMPTVG
jgi:hypothetical protein